MSRLLFALLYLPIPVIGLTYQNLWKVPDGDKADLSQTFQSGQTLPLSWEALNESTNDLWVTTFNYNEVKFSSLITRDIDISLPGTHTWTISIPSSQLALSAKYVLRFKPPASPRTSYNHDTVEISSPGFLVLAAAAASSASSATTTTSSATQTSTPLSSTLTPTIATATTASSAAPLPSSTSTAAAEPALSAGAKAGIGVGAAAIGIALAGVLAWLCFFRRRRRADSTAGLPRVEGAAQDQQQQEKQEQQPQETWGDVPVGYDRVPAELGGGDVGVGAGGRGGMGGAHGAAELPGEGWRRG